MRNSVTRTAQVNYDTLADQIAHDLRNWKRHSISLLGRVATVKMSVLLRILYLFQTIPAQPPRGLLPNLQCMIHHFIWGDAKPRLRLETSYLPPTEGGLGIPNLVDYFRATQIRFMLEWHREESEKQWLFQDAAISGVGLAVVPFYPKAHRPQTLRGSPITNRTLCMWDEVAVKRGLTSLPSPLTSFLDNPDFSPGLDRRAFSVWKRAKCIRAGQFFDLDGILPFTDLKNDYAIPESARLQYLQIRHWLLHSDIRPNTARKMTAFEKWLYTKTSDKHLI